MMNQDTTAAEEAWFDAEVARCTTLDQQEAAHLAERQHEIEGSLIKMAEVSQVELKSSWKERSRPMKRPSPMKFVIVGAGVGGLCMGARLREAGFDDFVILEKGSDLGGTWHNNNYPGVACDVASYFYSFTFFANPSWTQMFAPGSEIKRYLGALADHYGLRDHIRFGVKVDRCIYDAGAWHVATEHGDTFDADILIPATGFLHVPAYPAIEGLEKFKGRVLHSSQWEREFDVTGQRVGVIGNGSSAVQIVSNTVDRVSHLTVFQRTAQWVFPAPNDYYSEQRRAMLKLYPGLTRRLFGFFMDWYNNGFGNAVVGDRVAQKRFADACQANLDSIRNEELKRKLTPHYPVLCKRLVFSTTYYDALQRPNCSLVTEPIAKVEEHGVRTVDGELHAVDVLVLATGFDAHAYCRKLNIAVNGGLTLEQAWAAGARSYESVALAGFPNLFFIGGPYTTVGNLSTMTSAEMQVDFVIKLIQQMQAAGYKAIMPRKEQEEAFVAEMNASLHNTVWVSGCKSWYLDGGGGVDIWTKTPAAFMDHMQTGPDLGNYESVG